MKYSSPSPSPIAVPILCLCILCTLFVAACAKNSRTSRVSLCPKTFVAQPFAQLTLIDELRDTKNTLSFAKVQVICEKDQQQTTLLKLSFTLQLEKPLADKQLKKPLLIPLFAALTTDGKTLDARQSQRLQTTFDKKGRGQTSWLVAMPVQSPAPSESDASPTLYLGFEGNNIPLRKLHPKP